MNRIRIGAFSCVALAQQGAYKGRVRGAGWIGLGSQRVHGESTVKKRQQKEKSAAWPTTGIRRAAA